MFCRILAGHQNPTDECNTFFYRCLLIQLIKFTPFLTNLVLADPRVFYGKVAAAEFFVIQVRGDDGRVSVLGMGHRTHLDSRVSFFGGRVRIEYVKDKLRRNAVTRITIAGR